jgi:hypothetical protein
LGRIEVTGTGAALDGCVYPPLVVAMLLRVMWLDRNLCTGAGPMSPLFTGIAYIERMASAPAMVDANQYRKAWVQVYRRRAGAIDMLHPFVLAKEV